MTLQHRWPSTFARQSGLEFCTASLELSVILAALAKLILIHECSNHIVQRAANWITNHSCPEDWKLWNFWWSRKHRQPKVVFFMTWINKCLRKELKAPLVSSDGSSTISLKPEIRRASEHQDGTAGLDRALSLSGVYLLVDWAGMQFSLDWLPLARSVNFWIACTCTAVTMKWYAISKTKKNSATTRRQSQCLWYRIE